MDTSGQASDGRWATDNSTCAPLVWVRCRVVDDYAVTTLKDIETALVMARIRWLLR